MKKQITICTLFVFSFLCFSAAEMQAQTTIWSEDFTCADGTTQGSGTPPKWTINISGATITPPDDWFEVRSNQMEGRDVDGVAEWLSESINISGYSNVSASVDLTKEGVMESTDYIRVYYILDGGTETLFETHGDNPGNFDNRTATQTGLSGSTLEIIIRVKNSAGTEYHQFDNLLIQGTPLAPEIDVQRPAGTAITDGGTDNLGNRGVGIVSLDYTIDNTAGTDQLTVSTIAGANYTNVSGLTTTTPLPLNIASGTTSILNVSFDVGTGAFSFDLDINNNDNNEHPYDIQINGTGILPEINLKQGVTDIADEGIFDFGSTPVNSQTDVVFTIENTGLADLTLTIPLILTGTNADQFGIQTQPASLVAGSGGTTSFSVCFKPDSPGAKTAAIAIANSDDDENPYDLILNGTGVDSSPKISNIFNQTINEDASTGWLPFTLSDPDTDPPLLTVSAGTDNQTLLPNSGIAFKGTGANRFIKVTPAENQNGSGTVHVTVSDGSAQSRGNFRVSVTPVNDPPQFTTTFDSVTITQGETYQIPVCFLETCIEDVDDPVSSLSWSVDNNTHLLYTCSPDTITITAPSDWEGTETINITVSDGELNDTETLVITVQPAEQTAVQMGQTLPTSFSLEQNFPNPFNPVTTISYSLPEQTHVKLEVYNMQGQLIAILENGTKSAGTHTAKWNASQATTGIYLYQITTPKWTDMRKCMLVK